MENQQGTVIHLKCTVALKNAVLNILHYDLLGHGREG